MADVKYVDVIDANQNELRNALMHPRAAPPSSPQPGQIYWDTSMKALGLWDGIQWKYFGTLNQISTPDGNVSMAGQRLIGLANPTDPQDAVTQAALTAWKLSQAAAPDTDVSLNSHRLVSVADPVSGQDVVTLTFLQAFSSGISDTKDSVRIKSNGALPTYTRTNNVITAVSNGAFPAIDGITLTSTDTDPTILLTDGAAGSDNGIYKLTTTGSGASKWVLTRRGDADTSARVTSGMYVWVNEGGFADTGWLLTTNDPIVLNTTALSFTQISALGQITAGAGLTKSGATLNIGQGTGIIVNADDVALDTALVVRKYATSIGDNATTSIVVTHNLNTKDVTVAVYDNTTPFSEIVANIQHTSVNTVTIVFTTAPTTNQYRVVCHG